MQRLPRSESLAYPKKNTFLSKLQYYMRQNTKALLATLAFFAFVLVISSDVLHDAGGIGVLRGSSNAFLKAYGGGGSDSWGGAQRAGYFTQDGIASASANDKIFNFAIVTDLDELSRIPEERKPTFRSYLLPGRLHRSGDAAHYKIELAQADERTLITKHNEAGRGGEFSELTVYNNRLLTFDDRTGDVFEILNDDSGKDSFVVPRFVVTEGQGETDKGMKWEWSTVKDGKLYMGSMGKEYTNSKGEIVNTNNLWIATLNGNGELRREDWKHNYQVVRHALGADAPGYIIIEACRWSNILRKWVFLPRRISADQYDDVVDEQKGGDKLVLVNDNFDNPQVVQLQLPKGSELADPFKGFSTFAFIPGSRDEHILAVRTVEDGCAIDDGVCKQRSYIMVIDIMTGAILSDEIMISETKKFEGLEFVDLYTKPPPMA